MGMTFRGTNRRLNEHLCRARTGAKTHRDCWIRALLSAGVRPRLTVVERGAGPGWQDAERKWIAHHAAIGKLVNHTIGGDGIPGFVPSEKTRAVWSAQRKGVPYPPGRVAGMKGRRHTPEALAKIAESSRGRSMPLSARQKISAAHRGKTLSAEQRAMLAAVHSGKSLTVEHKAKIAASTRTRKRVVCQDTGETFESITAASRSLGVNEASVNQAIRKGCRCKGRRLRFA